MKNSNDELKKRGDRIFLSTYSRYPAAMIKGRGTTLFDADGHEYLDFLAGIAVCSLGHCHPAVTKAICDQAGKLVHASNLYYLEPQVRLGELICENSFAEKVFFANSGAEANEAAIKLARLHGGTGRYQVISLSGSFHGRTLATLAATGQPKFHLGFEPMPTGFLHAPFGDIGALEEMICDETCAILCEPLQGEGGVLLLDMDYLRAIRDLCDKYGLLLIFDEIQTGIGRTGTFFSYEQFGVTPDILTMAKAIGNGLPLGAMVTRADIGASFTPGSHGSTFGGNPVACAAAVAVLEVMLAHGFLDEVKAKGAYFRGELQKLVERFPTILSGVRGMGLILGAILDKDHVAHGPDIVNALFERGFLINFAGNTVLRFLPPLVVGREEIDRLITALAEVLSGLKSRQR